METRQFKQTRPPAPLAAIGLIMLAAAAAAQSTGEEERPSESASAGPASGGILPLPIEPKGLPPDPTELCQDKPGGLTWLDRMHAGLYRNMCLTAARFDGFFGNARFDDEYEATHGSISAGTLWDQRDHWDPSIRFRTHVRLPQLSEHFNAFFGRLDPEEYVTDARDDFDTLPRQFAEPDDDALLLGLGYRQPGPAGGEFDASVGVKFDWPPDAYVKGTYRLAQPFLERNLLRLQETIFWREEDRFGTTTRIDLERLLAEDFLVRWTSSGTFAQETEGLRWFSNLTLYQNLGKKRALAYQAGITGETEHEVDITDYGLRVIFRRRIHRDWLFLELRTGVSWPREDLEEVRETNWGAGVALEMQFGERRGRRGSSRSTASTESPEARTR